LRIHSSSDTLEDTFRGGIKPYIQSYMLEDASSDTPDDTLGGGVNPYIQSYTLEDTLLLGHA
jgi:hypothetical protein